MTEVVTHRSTWVAAVVAAASLLAASATVAQELNSRWTAWLGCWVPVGVGQQGVTLCFDPADDGTVDLLTFRQGRVATREAVVGDGEERATSRDGCAGTEALRFSDDGRRLYTRASQQCEDGLRRSATGIMVMVTPTQWLDVRAVFQTGEPAVSIQYYQLARPQVDQMAGVVPLDPQLAGRVRSARLVASVPLTLDDVVDASRHVHAAAVEAWVVENGDPLRFHGATLVRLADAGLPSRVIDVLVAVSFPRRFDVGRDGGPQDMLAFDANSGGGGGSAYGTPWGYGSTGYGAWSMYAPFGYLYPGFSYRRGYYTGYRPIFVTVTPASPKTSRVVNGRGYTQGRGSRSGVGSSSSGGSYSGGSSSGSSGGSRGSVSSGSSGSSRSTGRTAKRRRGGGG